MGCFLALFVFIFALAISACISALLSFATIWISGGLFNYDLSDKFWYVFVLWFFIVPALKGIFINVKR